MFNKKYKKRIEELEIALKVAQETLTDKVRELSLISKDENHVHFITNELEYLNAFIETTLENKIK